MGSRPLDVWLQENTKLCNAIRDYPCIYDRTDALFMEKEACEAAWLQISSKCNLADAKNRWRNIRSAFNRSYFSNKRRNVNTKYYLASALDWLLPHMPGAGDSEAGLTQEEDSMPSTSNNSVHEKSKRNASTDKDPLGDDDGELLSARNSTNETDADRRSRYQRACKRATSGQSPVKEAEPHQQSPKETTPKRRRLRKVEHKNSKETEPPHTPSKDEGTNARSTERSKSPSENQAKVDPNADTKSVKLKINDESKETANDSNGQAPSPSQSKLAEIDSFFKSVTPYILDMNKRQFVHFKKVVFGAIMEVFDDPKDFPDSEEVLVNPSPRSLIFENVTAKEHYLLRELVSTVIATKHSSDGSQGAIATSSPARTPVPPPPVPLSQEKVVEKVSEKASPDLPNSSPLIQVQPGAADAAKAGRNLYLLNSPSQRQQAPSNMSPTGLTGKVLRFGNGSIDPNSQVYRIVQKMPSGSVVVSKGTHPTQSSVNTFTIPCASSTTTLSNSSTVISSTSTLAAAAGSNAPGSSVVSLRAMPGFKPQQHQQTQQPQPSTAINKNILSMISPGKVGVMRRNSMAGVLPTRLERRTSTIVGSNMNNLVPANVSSVAVPRYAPGMPANRAVRTIMPIRTQGRAESTTIITRPSAAEQMPAPSSYGAPPMARSSPNTLGTMPPTQGRRGRPPGSASSMQVLRNSPNKMSPLIAADRPSPLQILEAENSISFDIKHEPEDL